MLRDVAWCCVVWRGRVGELVGVGWWVGWVEGRSETRRSYH